MTYSWDFGDGSPASTQQNPTHTYTTPGEKTAKLTVSDGEGGTATRNVTVNVLEPDNAAARFRVLVFSKTAGFRHSSIDPGHTAIEQLGADNNFQVDHTEDATAFRDDILSHYDSVIWLSTTGDVLNDTQQAAFERLHPGRRRLHGHPLRGRHRVHVAVVRAAGRRVLPQPPGRHAPNGGRRTVHRGGHRRPLDAGPAGAQLGPRWTSGTTTNRRSTRAVGGGGDDYSPRPTVHVLATLDESTYDEDDGNATDDDHPISWCQRYDGGRSWYTGMGHTDDVVHRGELPQAHPRRHRGERRGGSVRGVRRDRGRRPGGPGLRRPDDGQRAAPGAVLVDGGGSGRRSALSYKWEFGDGSSSLSQAPLHTYTTPGVYTAKVTVKDPDGHTGTDTVQVTVNAAGQHGPVDPEHGGRPGVRERAARRCTSRPTRSTRTARRAQLVYRWDFGDGGAPVRARRPPHVHGRPARTRRRSR